MLESKGDIVIAKAIVMVIAVAAFALAYFTGEWLNPGSGFQTTTGFGLGMVLYMIWTWV